MHPIHSSESDGREVLEVATEDLLPRPLPAFDSVSSLGEEFEIEGSIDPDQIAFSETTELETDSTPPPEESATAPVPDPSVAVVEETPCSPAIQIDEKEFMQIHRRPDTLRLLDKRLKTLRTPLCLPAEPVSDLAFPFDL